MPKDSLELKLFEEDGKSCACMMLDYFYEKRIPHPVAMLACLIVLSTMAAENGFTKSELKKMVFDMYESIKTAKNK